jgi:hypothetical protein
MGTGASRTIFAGGIVAGRDELPLLVNSSAQLACLMCLRQLKRLVARGSMVVADWPFLLVLLPGANPS